MKRYRVKADYPKFGRAGHGGLEFRLCRIRNKDVMYLLESSVVNALRDYFTNSRKAGLKQALREVLRARRIIVEWERRKAFGGPLSRSVTHRYVTRRYTFKVTPSRN
ncbi:hypothetical protein EVAR_91498_1 [Eumeta japonica]|uniref:Uncharacterized protein n=1 Tax=Eumeta variegata TaxID=151549 RepID=A0A4C1VCF3_EUMVA|nr:hypothetical protein EVAR_91498_1 [Eumeta japonica]